MTFILSQYIGREFWCKRSDLSNFRARVLSYIGEGYFLAVDTERGTTYEVLLSDIEHE